MRKEIRDGEMGEGESERDELNAVSYPGTKSAAPAVGILNFPLLLHIYVFKCLSRDGHNVQ